MKAARATRAGTSSRRCATQAAAISAASGGRASAERPRGAAPRPSTPLTTVAVQAATAVSAVSRSQAPAARLGTSLRDAPAQVAKRPRARDVRHLVEVVRRRRRRRVPLERVGDPRVVDRPRAGAGRPEDVEREDEDAEAHDPRADRRGEVVALPDAALVVGVDAARHPQQAEHVHREEGDVHPDEDQPEADLAEALAQHLPNIFGHQYESAAKIPNSEPPKST